MAYKIDKDNRKKGMKILEEMDLLKSSDKPISRDFMAHIIDCLLYTSPSPRDRTRSRMPSSA